MKLKAIMALFCTAALLTVAIILGSVFAVGKAMGEKNKYIDAEKRLALNDFLVAVSEMEKAAEKGDEAALNFAAGRAEAYLSRAGLDGGGEAYRMIGLIASGEYGADECRMLSEAAEKALDGDGDALLSFGYAEKRDAEVSEETTEDVLASRMLERICKGRDDVSLARATAFACPNAVFKETTSDNGSFKYSGDNIFISVGRANQRIMMYCFEREVDTRYSVSEKEAIKTVENVIKREKLKLRGDPKMELHNGVYRSVWIDDDSAEELVVIEVYADTGRLRLYNAVKYYENSN